MTINVMSKELQVVQNNVYLFLMLYVFQQILFYLYLNIQQTFQQ